MAYSEMLAARIRDQIGMQSGVTEKKMFGGIAWLVGGHMAVGTLGDDLMVRLSHDDAAAALDAPHVAPMDFTGRPMRGFIKVLADGIERDDDLARWIIAGSSYAATLPAKH
jgi:TfoX/Sxy family transcriptional regulator of competence genes